MQQGRTHYAGFQGILCLQCKIRAVEGEVLLGLERRTGLSERPIRLDCGRRRKYFELPAPVNGVALLGKSHN